MKNDYDQQLTYDLLKEMCLFKEVNGKTYWLKSHPFPKSNLLLHVLQGKNSENARRELIVEMSNFNLEFLENDWKKNRILNVNSI